MHTTVRPNPNFDGVDFECALIAADFDRCHQLVEGTTTLDGVIAAARLALRERRYLDVIGLLSDFPEDSDLRVARDVFLGAAFGYTRDYVAGQRLIDRALNDLLPGDPLYDEAHYLTGSIAWMQHDHQRAQEATMVVLRSSDPNNRARAHIMLSWIAVRRSDVLAQVEELEKALDELDSTESPDEYYRGNALLTLALLCREMPLHDVAERVRQTYDAMPWTTGLKLEHFQVTRFLASIDELQGNELAAFGSFKKAGKMAPSDHWSALCYLDRALLARNTGEAAFASEQLQEASDIAKRVSWSEVTGEEREALLVLAELWAHENPAIAEQYLARFRSLKSSVIPMLSYGSDPRVRGFESYSQGIAWLRLGDTQEGKAALTEAWSIFEDFNYGWRAALCALGLYEATNDKRWIERAARKIAPWPKSWIARRVAESKTSTVVPLERIPPAKREVLELLRSGQRNADIAKKLGRSPHTVRNQLAQLFQTFDVKSRAELVAVLSKQVVPINSVTRLQRKDH
ncbi:MAG TPA: LuxR C-terminal-related transcriptional regulator [Candidatus Cybelea sp.]|nr:LuxR C-terminal-related transcriptional regulator [Candidatus Cybelea sp.]